MFTGIVREVGKDALYDEQLLESGRTFEARQKDLAHPTRGQTCKQLVASQA